MAWVTSPAGPGLGSDLARTTTVAKIRHGAVRAITPLPGPPQDRRRCCPGDGRNRGPHAVSSRPAQPVFDSQATNRAAEALRWKAHELQYGVMIDGRLPDQGGVLLRLTFCCGSPEGSGSRLR